MCIWYYFKHGLVKGKIFHTNGLYKLIKESIFCFWIYNDCCLKQRVSRPLSIFDRHELYLGIDLNFTMLIVIEYQKRLSRYLLLSLFYKLNAWLEY